MTYLACDLGAESGRLMSGHIGDGRIDVAEIHRFSNGPLRREGSLHWDIRRLFEELKAGLRKASSMERHYTSLSTDSWGVDYALFDHEGELMEPVFHYRDARGGKGFARVKTLANAKQIFDETGIQFMPLNTIYQLATEEPARLEQAARILLIADAFNYLLCGEAVAEESLASTTQLYNPRIRDWSSPLIETLALPRRLFPRIAACGLLAPLREALGRETGLPGLNVVASCSHDTAAAVAAVPAEAENWAYISSGTWSLLGVEVAAPILSDACRSLNFTNEVGHGGTIRLLKNIVGLWIIQECRRSWSATGKHADYADLTRMAEASEPFRSLVHPADARFVSPDRMPEKIAAFCEETGQPPPRTPAETVRCALESLALLYRETLNDLQNLTGVRVTTLHIVGGGSRNALLNQFTANALSIPVLAGPVEATAMGNVLVQAIVAGELNSLQEGRALVRRSSPIRPFQPNDAEAWDDAYARFKMLTYSHPGCE